MKERIWSSEYLRDSQGALAALRFQLDGIVDGSANPEMQEAADFLDQINTYLALLEAAQDPGLSTFCPRCGVNMQDTHAPWCKLEDGTSVPDEDVQMAYALARCKKFVQLIAQSAMGDDRFLWALSDLLKFLAEWVYPLRQPF